MEQICLVGDGWESGPLFPARSFSERLRGIRGVPDGWGLLVETRSVHGFGLREPLRVVALDDDLEVLGTKMLLPNRIVIYPQARLLIELTRARQPPRRGTRLRVDG